MSAEKSRRGDVVPWQANTFTSLSSTQDYVRELAEEDFAEGTIIQSLVQTKGRGRHGREWVSPMGNLYMSVLLRPECAPDVAGQLSFVIAVALSSAIDEVLAGGHKKTLKWPNDVLIDGKKAAGILLESELDNKGNVSALICGIGVNIHAAPDDAVKLQDVTDEITVPVNKFRDSLIGYLKASYERWRTEGFEQVRKAWLEQAHGMNGPVSVKIGDREIKGILTDIDGTGVLKLKQENGDIVDITAGDVYFADAK